ncbi:MAG: hypothetical protein PWR30_35 [Candidatus Woesearchaeota archaeon]|nr:hypothetical protein [Candidatus Woesearchaeota archaeon]
MKSNKVVRTEKLMIFSMGVFCFLILPIFASPLEDAKEIIDDYYSYSKEQNVDGYISLFDEDYLEDIYGNDYKEFLKEVLSYIKIEDYKLDYQYYTEGEESLTLFFNLKADVVIEGEKTRLDNDMVAFFSKENGNLKLRYSILQETFIEKMNQEVIYKAAIVSYAEENSDLKKEAEEKGVELVDYKSLFEERINSHHKPKAGWWILLTILLIVIGGVYFIFKKGKVKKDDVKKQLDKAQKKTVKTVKYLKDKYNKTAPVVVGKTKEFSSKVKKKLKNKKKHE